jgi:replicative DNA helicase
MTRGFRAGDLIIIAGRPSMGKTSLVGNIAEYVSARSEEPVVFFSLEMGRDDVLLRMICSNARVNFHQFSNGRLPDRDVRRISESAAAVEAFKFYIDDGAGSTLLDIRATCRRIRMREGLALVIIDYLQLMTGHVRAENRTLELATITRGLKMLAKDLGVPVVALSQLSRANENRADKRPQLSDLRESGAIEQDADVVVFVHRPEMYERTEENAGLAELILAKQRNGPTGVVNLTFVKEEMRFANLAAREDEAERRFW